VRQKLVIVSAVNFSEGGPLTVLLDCLISAVDVLGAEWCIVALVHKRSLVSNSRVHCIEFPFSKRSWGRRICLEWWYFKKLSKKMQPDLWLSLHDVTPLVCATRQAVYCHNPSPFYRMTLREAKLEPTLLLFNLFYKYLYRINIYSNRYVIVQQDWIRVAFRKMYSHPAVVVAHPKVHLLEHFPLTTVKSSEKTIFLYPALPRVFKNFEVLCRAVECLSSTVQERITVRMTIDGSENRYARSIVKRFGTTIGLQFIGKQSIEDMLCQYAECDVLLFPSKIETWGLPITEAKAMGKPLLVADLPYAKETVGLYADVSFLAPDDDMAWARKMEEIALGCCLYDGNKSIQPKAPYAADWPELWKLLTSGL